MIEIRYYLSLFIRRLPLFLPVATAIAAVAVIVAMALPPAYVSETRLLVQAPQIPANLAPSTVQVPALERLQIIQQQVKKRENMLEIARQVDVVPGLEEMSADQIVSSMRARTNFSISSGRNQATLMTVSFEAPAARTAAEVLGEYLTLIQQQDVEFRRGRAGDTVEFFESQVSDLRGDLDSLSNRILEFKDENDGALPGSLDFRMSRRGEMKNSLGRVEREIKTLEDQRERLEAFFDGTGQAPPSAEDQRSPDEQRLADLRARLDEQLAVYSETAPQVKTLQARIARLEERVAAAPDDKSDADTAGEAPTGTPNSLDLRLSEIDSQLARLSEREESIKAEMDELDESIERTPQVASRLEALNREYATLERRLSSAEERLNSARTGDLIENRSRGQRLSLVEPPAVPSTPTKPNRLLIAGGGSAVGLLVGAALVTLLELINSTARRPEDLVRRFNVAPLATIPFIRTRGQTLVQRGAKIVMLLAILVGVPAAIYAVHIYYLPLDLLADRLMNKIGVRL